ncbi:MAG: hypothetical protein JKY50_07920 [Oleispira sp.]|nr:hypothetical protein [Oleispira sp.]MBL4880205.1 hypothetical protein [Oleispira sp.]
MKKTLKLDPILRVILVDQAIQQFTVTELRDLYTNSYQRSTGKEIDSGEARKWLYRRIYKMASAGYLDKIHSEKGTLIGYKLSKQFYSVKIKDASYCHLDSLNEVKKMTSNTENKTQNILKSLEDKAKQYQVDLDSCISEAEEYKLLYESYPSLKLQLETQYELSKNKSSKLLGQLTATKKILSQLSMNLAK